MTTAVFIRAHDFYHEAHEEQEELVSQNLIMKDEAVKIRISKSIKTFTPLRLHGVLLETNNACEVFVLFVVFVVNALAL